MFRRKKTTNEIPKPGRGGRNLVCGFERSAWSVASRVTILEERSSASCFRSQCQRSRQFSRFKLIVFGGGVEPREDFQEVQTFFAGLKVLGSRMIHRQRWSDYTYINVAMCGLVYLRPKFSFRAAVLCDERALHSKSSEIRCSFASRRMLRMA